MQLSFRMCVHLLLEGRDVDNLIRRRQGSPHWISENGTKPIDLHAVRAKTLAVPIPPDPVGGDQGHLPGLWREALEKYTGGG